MLYMALTPSQREAVLRGNKSIEVDGLKKTAHDPEKILAIDDRERIREARANCTVPQIIRAGMFRITPTR